VAVRVVDADTVNYPAVVTTPSVGLTVKGQLSVTTPPGAGQADTWRVGDTDKLVQWTAQGQLGTVKIELDPDDTGPLSFVEITDPANRPNASLGNWAVSNWYDTAGGQSVGKIPDLKTLNAVLKVTQVGGTQASATSLPFAIYPKITNVTVVPATQDASSNPPIWRSGMQNPTISVEWNDTKAVSTGPDVLTSVDIYLSTTGFGGLPGSVMNTGYSSTVNGTNSSNSTPAKTLTVPNNIIVNSQAVVRVRDSNAAFKDYVYEDSGLFSIYGNITFSAPLPGNTWLVDATDKSIAWNAAGPMGNLNIYVNYGLGAGWEGPIATVDSGVASSWPWNPIPNKASTNVELKITDADQETTTAFLSGPFTIQPWFTVDAPANLERVPANPQLLPPNFLPYTIRWTRHGNNPYVRLYYSLDGFSSNGILINETGALEGPDVSPADGTPDNDGVVDNDGEYDWRVPDLPGLASGPVNVTVRVAYSAQPVNNESAYDDSDPFKIVAGFAVLTPTLTDRWKVTSNQSIQWVCSSANVSTVRVEYSKDDGANYVIPALATSADNSGAAGATRTLPWNNIPDAITHPSFLRVKVTANNDASASAVSSTGAKIVANFKSLQVIDPPVTPTTDLKVGRTYNVTWGYDGSGPTLNVVKLEYSKDNFQSAGINLLSSGTTTGNDGQYEWQVPDDIFTGVKIKVQSGDDPSTGGVNESDPDAYQIATASYKIRGHFDVLAPDGGEGFGIYDVVQNPNTSDIQWQTVGSIARVDLLAYTTDPNDLYFRDGAGTVHTVSYPYTITTGLLNTPNGTKTFPWQVPDKASPSVKIRVVQADDPATSPQNEADAAVYDDSLSEFKIQGSLTISSPTTGAESWVIGTTQPITWNKTGSSITHVKISYSTQSATGPTWIPIDENPTPEGPTGPTQATDGIVDNDGSFVWTIPDVPDRTVWMKIEDLNPGVETVSQNPFRIRGNFTFNEPNNVPSVERWVTNEGQNVIWNTTGSLTAVDLQYSVDNVIWTPLVSTTGATATDLVNVPNGITNFSWRIPNVLSTNMQLRLIDKTDPSDPTPLIVPSPTFTTDWYTINFEVRDLLTNLPISSLNVSGSETLLGNPGGAYPWNLWADTIPSGTFPKSLPYGSWNVTFTQANYGDQGAVFLANKDHTDTDPSDADTSDDPITVYMETKVVHIWEAMTDMTYDVVSNTLYTASTLRRDGITVTGATSAKVKIYDGTTLLNPDSGSEYTLPLGSTSPPPSGGFYNFTWVGTTLQTGRVYNVITTMTNASGGTFNTPRTFSITDVAQLQAVTDTVNEKLTVSTGQLETNLNTALATQTTTIQGVLADQNTLITGKLDAQTSIIQNTMNTFSGQIAGSIVSLEQAAIRSDISATNLETAADRSLSAAEEVEAVGKKYGAKLLLPPSILMGETIIIRYRSLAGLAPTIKLFTLDKDNKTVTIQDEIEMKETEATPGLYEYSIKVLTENKFLSGKPFTVFVQESSTGNLEAGSVFVEGTSLTNLEGLIASSSGVKNVAQEALDAINVVKGTLDSGGNIGRSLELLRTRVDRIPRQVAEEGTTVRMRQAVDQVATTIKQLAGSEGYDFSQLMRKGLEESPTLKDVRQKTDEVQGATEVMQILMERKLGGLDEPVVHVLFE
jgi:hypothetical protein